ncbi:efflux RND transporter permease subunit [Kaistia dalseonensis]|uniref:Multidrug efflux pump subunit AcrB n=1 Tax=Kaistia dalseonensis TaxID=410840 RepID=A0ABU0HDF2_9HYPH|nr:efflux RND transporter permease subunit [Kaistia dalseonensis]MCX5497702.1 efflux RND transporter permease subunit [Kaistia dalseonensis]MDQ0440346.1 multidrug efflux pump subunit AcrB [Kaistia dalseonensis]
MNWNFSSWAIRNPVPPILLFVVLCAFGIVAFMGLPITRFPNIDVPIVSVTVTDSGTAPAELETQVTKKVEDAVAAISGVKHITSTITDGSSNTAIEFRLEVNTDRALNDVKDAIAKIRGDLPRTVDEPIVQRIDVEGQSIMTYGASAPAMSPEELSWFIDDTAIRALQALKGVGRVERMGGVTREIDIRLDPDRLMALGVTAADVNRQLQITNVDLSGGKGEVGSQEQTIRTLAGAKTLDDLANTRIALSGGREVRLAELGTVEDHWQEPKSFARLDGRPAVAMSIYRAKGASDASVAELVRAKIAELGREHPDVTFSQIDDTVTYTYGNYQSAMDTLYEGAALAILVVLLFLRDWRATLVAAVALPLSAIPTFWAISMLGFSLNLVSLLGITLVTGILVDDAIVEIENIVRHTRMGKKPYRAAIEAADEIGLAVIAISMTIIAIFAPVSFMSGIAGQYFRQFGLTVAVAVFFSLLVARLITPMMAAYFMRVPYVGDGSDGRPVYTGFRADAWRRLRRIVPVGAVIGLAALVLQLSADGLAGVPLLGTLAERVTAIGWIRIAGFAVGGAAFLALFGAWLGQPHPEEEHDGWIMRSYTALLRGTLRPGMRWVTLGIGIATFVVAIQAMGMLPSEFIPEADESRLVVSIELPPGTPLDDTAVTTDAIAERLRALPEIQNVFVMGGTSPTGTLEPRRAALILTLTPKEDRTRSQKEMKPIIADALADIPDIRFYVVNDRGDRETTVAVIGRDGEAVVKAASDLEAAMKSDPMFSNPVALASFARPEIRIVPKLDEASDLGLAPDRISETIRVATSGDADSNLAKFTVDGRQIPIRVQLDDKARQDLSVLAALRVPLTAGGSVPLASVADIGFGEGPATIERYDRERLVKVGTDMAKGFTSGQGGDRIKTMDVVKSFPAGVHLQDTGDAEAQAEVFSAFGVAMGSGIMLVFVVLIILFNNVFQPITILASLPLSIGGVVAALLLTNNAFSMPVIIGVLMLMGIVTKNAIMLVDFAVEREKHGMDRKEAIIDAGRKRARPIVMTTIAMAAGMVPAALALGQGGEFRSPMAIAVMGGLLVSTVLSLVFIPSVYTIMDDFSALVGRVFGWAFKPNTSDEREDEDQHGEPPRAVGTPAMRIAAE